MPRRARASQLIVIAIVAVVLFGGVAASVVLAPEYAIGQAAIRTAATLPEPSAAEREAVLARDNPWFWTGSMGDAWREIVNEPREPLWLSRPRCNMLCRMRRALVIATLKQQYSRETLLRAYVAARSARPR